VRGDDAGRRLSYYGVAVRITGAGWRREPASGRGRARAGAWPRVSYWLRRAAVTGGGVDLGVVKSGGGGNLIGMPSAGIQFDLSQALRSELSLRASYFGTWHDFEQAIALIADGTIPAEALLVSYALDNVLTAFADAEAQRVLKPLVRP